MADAETLALLQHIKDIGERTEQKLDQHIAKDETLAREFTLPLWNNYQQQKGAGRLLGVLYTLIGGGVVAAIDFFYKGHTP